MNLGLCAFALVANAEIMFGIIVLIQVNFKINLCLIMSTNVDIWLAIAVTCFFAKPRLIFGDQAMLPNKEGVAVRTSVFPE